MLQIKKIINFTNCSKCQVLCIVFKEKINLKTKTFIENTLFQLEELSVPSGRACLCLHFKQNSPRNPTQGKRHCYSSELRKMITVTPP